MNTLILGKNTPIGEEMQKLHKGRSNVLIPSEKEVNPKDKESFQNYIVRNSSISKIIYLYDINSDNLGNRINEKAKQNCIDSNINGVQNVVDAIINKDMRLFLVSSYKVYPEGIVEEKYVADENNVNSEYAKQKCIAETIVRKNLKTFVIFRLGELFYSGDKFVTPIIKDINSNKEIIKAEFDAFISPLYVKDAAMYISFLAIDRFISDGVYNISNDGACTKWHIAKEILRILNKKKDIEPIESKIESHECNLGRLADARVKVRHWKDSLESFLVM